MLEKAGIDSRRIAFVSADLGRKDWLLTLVDEGFDRAGPTSFLWVGVTMYLKREAVEDTLRVIASTARRSVVAFDFFTTEPLESRALYWRYARMMTGAGGEPLLFGIESTPPLVERLAESVRSCGLSLVDHRTLAKESEDKRAWGGFATAIVS
jgi:O-methyltransferase involved in polyketide biosynthesis